jgi:chromate transporter
MPGSVLWVLVLVFVPLSFVTIGGGAAILAPLNHQAVDVHHWLSQREFVDLFAISRAAPGPGSMLVALVGWKVARWAGALVAVVATFLPSSLLCYGVARAWNRYRGTALHSALERGLAPVGTGLLMAGAFSILRAAHAGVLGWGIALGATAILAWRNLHPLIILFAGGAVHAAASALSG